METATVCESTFQSVSGADLAKFLRKVIRHNQQLSWSEEWQANASESTKWCLEFYRTVKGAVGEPDVDIRVRTDVAVGRSGKTGVIQPFGDAKAVIVRSAVRVHIHGSHLAIACKLLLMGCKLSASSSCGSTNSAEHGLSFYSLEAKFPDLPYASVDLGSTTVAKDGDTLISGAVDIR